MIIQRLIFNLTIYPLYNRTNIGFFLEPNHINLILQYYQDVCRNLDEFNQILINLEEQRKLPKPTKNLGRNDSSLIVHGDMCILDCEYVSGLPPLEIPTNDVVYFFEKLREFFIKYENGEIPGIIPQSKLATWSCVPNEYVKPEYWELLKQQEPDKSN